LTYLEKHYKCQHFADIHICKPHKPTHKPKLAKEYACPIAPTTDSQTKEKEQRRHNSTYKKLAVQWLNEALCFVLSFVLADSFVLRNRQLLVAAKRYLQPSLFRHGIDFQS